MANIDATARRECTVRPLSSTSSTNLTVDSFRIQLSLKTLKFLGLKPGGICQLQWDDEKIELGLAWPAAQAISDGVVQLSGLAQEIFGLKNGDKVQLSQPVRTFPQATSVVYEISSGKDEATGSTSKEEKNGIEWLIRHSLAKTKHICSPSLMTVQHPNGSKLSVCLHKVDRSSSELSNIKVAEVKGAAGLTLAASQPSPLETEKRSQDDRKSVKTVRPIAGLEPYVQLVNQQLKLLQLAANSSTTRRGCQPGSVLLHGPSGIGKSLILDKIAESSGERTTYRIGRQSPSRISSKLHDSIQDVFLKARNHECAIILIDELDEIAPEDALGAGRLEHLSVLCQSLEQVWRDRKRVICIATSRHVSRAHQSLRKPTGFETEIEIAPPDREARLRILLSLFPPTLGDKTKKLLQDISWKTHGYVGADLDLLVRRASQYELLATEESSGILPTENSETTDRGGQGISQSSLQKALVNTQPTAMREVLLEPPQVRWEDIGGQHEVKKKLKQAVEWPLRHGEVMKKYGINARRGILLYGPPGCSKTLSARAVATEADLNFLAVKGAELVNMYLGESERALRELFRKARSVSPSVIFFDEIDSIAAGREQQHGSLNLLTTLLNEMDGIEVLKDVVVMAATNRPEILDAALLRPGRFDTLIYVGPPDVGAREEIIKLKLAKMLHAEDLSAEVLAVDMDGYSGAEIVNICDGAGYLAMEDFMRTGNLAPVGYEHFTCVIGETRPQITDEMKQRYESWSPAGVAPHSK